MFNTITMKKNSVDFTCDDHASLTKYVSKYAQRDGYEWLNEVMNDAKYKWCKAMTVENGINGAYDWMSDTIFLMPDANREEMQNMRGWSPDIWSELVAPTAVHELRHRWQRKQNIILYILCCFPIVRQLTLERDAWKHTPKFEGTEPLPGFEEQYAKWHANDDQYGNPCDDPYGNPYED